ncbi:MAG: emrB qacA [Rhizobacter sp.]|nr:emrB qacA [Rhizobacter sp.]
MPEAGNFRIVAMVVAGALFMQNIDGTIVATAVPPMARALGVKAVDMSAVITAYVVALTVFIPISGWVADRLGAKRVFMAAVAVFTLASALCAASHSLGQLIGARVLQGMGGAMMVPVGRLLLLRRVRREELLTATTWFTVPALVGPVLGPPLGGLITDTLSWQYVFWINLPVGALCLLLSWRLIPPTPPVPTHAPDLVGMALMGSALTLFMTGIETAGKGLVPPLWAAASAALGLVLGWLTIRHCRRVPHPAVDLTLLSIPTFNASTIAGSLFRTGAGAVPFLVPITLQIGFGLSASQSGLFLLASSLGSFFMRPMTQLVLRRFSVRSSLMAGTAALAATLCGLAICAPLSMNAPVILLLLLFNGLARSMTFAVLGALAFVDVPADRLSAATSFQGTAQQLPKALGVVIAAAAMQVSVSLLGHEQLGGWDFAVGYVAVAIVMATALPLFASLSANAGEGMASRGGVPEIKKG